jgi:hypothetical protein
MEFMRPLSLEEVRQWEELLDSLQHTQINEKLDKVKWNLEKSGVYSTRSMYRFLLHRRVVNKRM